jgi:uncharacterized Fe-S cluster protein YjdI
MLGPEEEPMRRGIVKHYTRDGVTIVWRPGVCIHARRCFHGLPAVFDPSRRPWVDLDAADLEQILDQVSKCPSGALSIKRNEVGPPPVGVRAELVPDGPLVLRGELTLALPDGGEQACVGTTAFCRCGASGRKPFCDGSHRQVAFKG